MLYAGEAACRLRRLNGETVRGWLRRATWVTLFGEGVGPFEMLLEKEHPLVRAEMKRTRRKRVLANTACVAFPLMLFTGLVFCRWIMMGEAVGVRAVLSIFVCAWPLAMVLGASVSVAGAVLTEMKDGTALQWVLTLMPARPLAAAKILCRVQPFALGTAAALPLYMWAGTCPALLFAGALPSPVILWPLRLIALSGGWGECPFGASVHPAGLALGAAMCLADFVLVWVATHWCAAEAIGRRSLPAVVATLLLRLVTGSFLLIYMSLVAAVPLVVTGLIVTSLRVSGAGLVLAIVSVPVVLFFLFLCWRLPLRAAVNMAIAAFMNFDDLALDP